MATIDQCDVPIRPRDGDRYSRQTAARTYVSQMPRAALKNMRQDGERIEQVLRNHPIHATNGGEVVRSIPFLEQRQIIEKLLLRVAVDLNAELRDSG